MTNDAASTMRLNRFLAQCGLGSRRAVETLIVSGKVAVNGRKVSDLATQIDPAHDRVEVDGKRARPAQTTVYLMMNKPRGYEVTRVNPGNHRRAYDLLPEGTHASVKAVGRLDRESTGMLLFTNDGELAHRLTHPRYGCTKTYDVVVQGKMSEEKLRQLSQGVELDDGPAKALSATRLEGQPPSLDALRIVMSEGRKRIVRRMCETLGHPVLHLHRIEMGKLKLGELGTGKVRVLKPGEVARLKQAAGLEVEAPAKRKPGGGKRPGGRPGGKSFGKSGGGKRGGGGTRGR